MNVVLNMKDFTLPSVFRRFGMIFEESMQRERESKLLCLIAGLPVFCLYLSYHSIVLSGAVVFVLLSLLISNYYYV